MLLQQQQQQQLQRVFELSIQGPNRPATTCNLRHCTAQRAGKQLRTAGSGQPFVPLSPDDFRNASCAVAAEARVKRGGVCRKPLGAHCSRDTSSLPNSLAAVMVRRPPVDVASIC